jgi:hypothetical protein
MILLKCFKSMIYSCVEKSYTCYFLSENLHEGYPSVFFSFTSQIIDWEIYAKLIRFFRMVKDLNVILKIIPKYCLCKIKLRIGVFIFLGKKKEVVHRTTSSPNQIKPNYKFILCVRFLNFSIQKR